MDEKRQKSKTASVIPLLRRVQVICAVTVLVLSLAERTQHRWTMYAPSHCVARSMLVTACTSLLTTGLASLGLFATTRPKDYRDIVLTVDTLALLSSITMAVCITIAIHFASWTKTPFCILSFDMAWVALCIAIILFVRDVRLLLRNGARPVTTRRPFIATRGPVARARRAITTGRGPVGSRKPMGEFLVPTRPSDNAIAAWCHTVKHEAAPLLPPPEGFQMSSDWDAQSNMDVPDRAASPISAVANWSTVTGTTSLAQFSTAPPPYNAWTEKYADE